MKERPMLFSGPMVRAILSGTKTQTRRLVTGTPRAMKLLADCKRAPEIEDIPDQSWMDTKHGTRARWQIRDAHESPDGIGDAMNAWCPYGHRWTRLWVRETWADRNPLYIDADGDMHRASQLSSMVAYRSTEPDRSGITWRPSIHMPRWASRLTLEITGVRVERLQDISEADAQAEGVDPCEWSGGPANESACGAFRELWDSLNAKRGPWSSNPWTWVVSFKRVAEAEERAGR